MTIATCTVETTTIDRGTVYTVTWSDGTDPRTIAEHTPASVARNANTESPPAWLMVGAALLRFIEWIRRYGVDPGALEFSEWSDPADIADQFARAVGLADDDGNTGRVGFDPEGMPGVLAGHPGLGGRVEIVSAVHRAGAQVVVRPLDIGSGWIALVAKVSPVERVLAIPAKSVAVVTANMLGSSCRRTRAETLVFLAEHAHGSVTSMLALLNLRRRSTGLSPLEARAARLGELIGIESALLCPHLHAFAEGPGRAAISLLPADEDRLH